MNASPRLAIDETFAARWHASARSLAVDDFLRAEVARRLIERLDTIRLEPSRVLDIGCGTGRDLALLARRFPAAHVVGIDRAPVRVARAAQAATPRTGSFLGRLLGPRIGPPFAAADFAALPFAPRTFDALWSNLALHWSAEPHRVLPEWSRVTTVGGLVAFSCFGPDTLREVRDAFAAVDLQSHVLPFTDMHDYGDMLIEAGFVSPVVDMERLTLTYADADSLWRDVRALGRNATPDRPRGLKGRRFGWRLAEALAQTRTRDGRYALTFELVFAHAWKGEPRRTSGGETIVRLERKRGPG